MMKFIRRKSKRWRKPKTSESSTEMEGSSTKHRFKMENLKRRFSFRKKKDSVPECSKPHQWQEDEKKVREGSCSFQVRYLGCIEVFESRGMNICEEAVKALKLNSKGKSQRAILYVSGDALRVVDEISKSMIVDQTIEKVSFCAPDRNHEKGFAYICRDGTTRRWMCHGFMAVKESVSGERLSHAVGCAFAICLERKQKRDKETGVTVTYSQDKTSFTRTGSFRQTTLTERLVDPQSALVAEPVPVKSVYNPYAVQRPHATSSLLERQGSFRGFGRLQEESSPFKRSLSLRLNELPSTLQRQDAILESPSQEIVAGAEGVYEKEDGSISHMCQQLTQGLSAMAGGEDPFSDSDTVRQEHVQVHTQNVSIGSTENRLPTTSRFQDTKISQTQQTGTVSSNHFVHNGQIIQPALDTNPWASTKQTTNPFVSTATSPPSSTVPSKSEQSSVREPSRVQHFPNVRSHSIDSGELPSRWNQPKNMAERHQQSVQQNGTVSSRQPSSGSSFTAQPTSSVTLSQGPGVDPFDVAWAAKAVNGKDTNPFSASSKNVKQFEVKL